MSDDEAGGGAAEKRKRKRKHGGGADKQAEKAAKEEVVTSLPVGVEAYNNDRTLYIEVHTRLLTHQRNCLLTYSLNKSGTSIYGD